jgi:hypothetical protein
VNKNVKKQPIVGWSEHIQAQLTANTKVIRRVINNSAERELIRGWHDFASRGQKHQKHWCRQQKVPEGVTPLGLLCLEAAKQAVRGVSWELFIDTLQRCVEPNEEARYRPMSTTYPPEQNAS